MLRTIRNLIVNIMAACIRDRDARHKFRNRYKIRSKFRKLRDDNRRLFYENKLLENRINRIQNSLDNVNHKKMFKITNKTINSCKNFLDLPDLTEKYKKLISGLDEESIACVTQILGRTGLIARQPLGPDENAVRWLDIFTEEELQLIEKIRKEFRHSIVPLSDGCYSYRHHILPINRFGTNVFYHKHDVLKLKHIDKIRNKDVIDAGGNIADSAIMFTEYINGKIYTFEPTSEQYDLMLKTIELNGCKNIYPVKLALGSKDETMIIKLYGGASTLNKDMPAYEMTDKSEEISVTTLDKFLSDKDVDIGLIKVDIEGFEQEFLKGAYNTIKKFKPAMLISIYHNQSDFFNIKPIVDTWNLGYKFQISHPVDGGLRGETLLICECD